MIYVFENTNNGASIVFDERSLSEEDKVRGVALAELPLQEDNGKEPILKCRKSTNEVWWEYKDTPATKEALLEERISSVEIAMAQMMGV